MGLEVDVVPFGQLIEDFIHMFFVVSFNDLALDVGEGAGSGEDEGGDGGDFVHRDFVVEKVLGEAAQDDADEDGFLFKGDVVGLVELGLHFLGRKFLLVIAVFEGIGVAARRAEQAGVGGAKRGICVVDGPGLTGRAGGDFGGTEVHGWLVPFDKLRTSS